MDTAAPTYVIRKRLGQSQEDFAAAIGVSQGSVSAYEHGRQEISPAVAKAMVAHAKSKGLALTLDQVYGLAPIDEAVAAAGA